MKWFLFSALILALPARAQTPAVGQKIEYRRDVPKSVARLMPRGAKSLFWGCFVPKAGSAPMAIHLIALNPKEELSTNPAEGTKYHFSAEVWSQKSGNFHRVNRVPVVYQASIGGSVRISARLFWINSRSKLSPVLVFNCFTPGETYIPGEFGDAVVAIFPSGWEKTAAVQTFPYGASSFSRKSYKITADKDGIMQILTSESLPGTFSAVTFRWNREKSRFERKKAMENGFEVPTAP